ncbi:peptide deformylase [Oscillospiraceae bacterium CM]|nr:peptide deformylase [Oscillospiraceae bacterium CM]
MALRQILKDGDTTLIKKSRAVTDFNARLHQLLDDMRETLSNADGVGLAAPQVGVLRRAVLVVDTTGEGEAMEECVLELINPEIVTVSGEQTGTEGCLSVPGVYGIVTRPETVTVRAQDRFGSFYEVTGSGLTARAFCHEINHLDGILFTELATEILTPEQLEEMAALDEETDSEA